MVTKRAPKAKTKKSAKVTDRAGRKHPVVPELAAVGRRVRAAREKQGLSQDQVARAMGTSAQRLGQLEQGWWPGGGPSLLWLHRVARAVASTPSWIIVGINEHLARAVERVMNEGREASRGRKTG